MGSRKPTADERWMTRAIALAHRGEGLTRPNPPVGAVLVKNGRYIGEGYHHRAGGVHAEVNAFRRAGEEAKGATLYVTLEPCSTWGRTPPCTDAILKHGVRRVVIGVVDPNPKHAGRGIRLLRKVGVEVEIGVCKDECTELIEPFAMHQANGRPFVTLKLGSTLDGRIADAKGTSRWITGAEARRKVHKLRGRVDAILVGRNTAQLDDPSLLPVPSRGRKPFRVVLDAAGTIPLRHRLFTDQFRGRTLLFTSTRSSRTYRDTLQKRGVEIELLPATSGHFSLRDVLASLGRRDILHVLCEGGGALAGSLIREKLVDEAWFFFAPRILGGDATPSIGGKGWPLSRAPKWIIKEVTRSGNDVLIRARPEQ